MLFRILFFLFCLGCSVKPLYNHDFVTANNIYVDVIAERDGQKLRSYLMDYFRNLNFSKKNYRLSVNLTSTEKPFAIANDGNARRVRIYYIAHLILKDNNRRIVLKRSVSVSNSSNISSAQGEVVLSLYGRKNDAILKELSYRIVENIKVFLFSED